MHAEGNKSQAKYTMARNIHTVSSRKKWKGKTPIVQGGQDRPSIMMTHWNTSITNRLTLSHRRRLLRMK
jgi:hypothetical protein